MNNRILCLCSIFCCLFFSACSFDVEKNRRVEVTGTVVNFTENPIANILIESKGDRHILGSTITNSEGQFSFTSLESDAQDFSIEINGNFNNFENDSPLTSFLYSNTSLSFERDRNDYYLGQITLAERAILAIDIRRTSSNNATINWSLTFSRANCSQIVEDYTLINDECYPEISIQSQEDEINYTNTFDTVRFSNAIFEYSINNGATQQVQIPINDLNTTYEFEY